MTDQTTRCHLLKLTLGVLLVLTVTAPNAGLAAGYYEGETITVVIGLDAAAGGSTVGRLLAKHLEQHLEGEPTVIVNNHARCFGFECTSIRTLEGP